MWVFATGKENFYRQVMTGGMHLTFASSELTLNTITLAKSLFVKKNTFQFDNVKEKCLLQKDKKCNLSAFVIESSQ